MRIGIDIDGVVSNWVPGAARLAERTFGLLPGELHTEVSTYSVEQAWGVDPLVLASAICESVERDVRELYGNNPWVADVHHGLHRLFVEGVEIFFVTSRGCTCEKYHHHQSIWHSTNWHLAQLADQVGFDFELIMAKDKTSRNPIVRDLNLDFMVDDDPRQFDPEHPEKFILFDRSWNREAEVPQRGYGWVDTTDKLLRRTK